MKTATQDKPDVSERISIRVSKVAKQRIRAICLNEHLDEALVVRVIVEAGISLCEDSGLEGALRSRREFLNSIPGGKKSPSTGPKRRAKA